MRKEIVVIGGGFAGINLVRRLADAPEFHVTLVDRNNYNAFPPLLYQVATSFLETSNICYPFRKLFHGVENVSFHLGELQRVLLKENKVVLTTGELPYDYLVLATGTESNYFGMENIRQAAFPLKTVDDAIEIRNYMLQKMEEASRVTEEAERKKLTTVVIAGGGPTGVEIAGMLAEMRENILEKDYPELRDHCPMIYLVDGSPSLLSAMSEKAQQYAYDNLMKMGVEVRLNKSVKDYLGDTVIFTDGETIRSRILFWTTGVTGSMVDGVPPESYGPDKRLRVDGYNKVVGTHNVYAVGDACFLTSDENFPQGHPQLAQVALQQGKNLAANFIATLQGKPLTPFSYKNKGSMAIIGRHKAVADLPKPEVHITGWIAWQLWVFVHLFSLINYRNRIKTLYNWAAAYFTGDQSLRMIIRPAADRRKKEE